MQDDAIARLTSYYDEVPYDSNPFPQSTPEHLEAIACVFGVDAVPPAGARVLELGCASGGNLIPFAARYPASRCLGVDLSQVQVERARQAALRAGLSNVEFRAMDMSAID
ncbi:MAG: class I SAM-dependent methyltransferase, partial [Comamonadaceae bacterium]